MEDEKPEGAKWRGIVSSFLGVGWLVWALLYWFFWSEDMEISQKMAVMVMSLLVLGTAMGALWIPWSRKFPSEEGYSWWMPGFGWRVVVSTIVGVGSMLFIAWWLWTQGEGYSLCQSCVVIIVVLIVVGALMGVMWGRKRMKVTKKTTIELRSDVVEGVATEIEEGEGD